MNLLLLLLTSPHAMGDCPRFMEEVQRKDQPFPLHELFDVACGRKSFSSEFWNKQAMAKLVKLMAGETIIRNPPALCSSRCIENMDEEYGLSAYSPLLKSVREAIDEMDNAEAAREIHALYNRSFTLHIELDAFAGRNAAPKVTLVESSSRDGFADTTFSIKAQAAIMQALKRAFGIEDTSELRLKRISVAMNALRNAEYPRDEVEIMQLMMLTRELFSDANSTSPDKQTFESYVGYVKMVCNEWIRAVEIMPAVEILYVQYLTLKNEEAKAFVDKFISTWSGRVHSVTLSGKKGELQAFHSLSNDASSALESTFPELFQYLYKNDYIVKKKNLEI